jgi:protocatechuate 3,4-dioxygenase, beta subunit
MKITTFLLFFQVLVSHGCSQSPATPAKKIGGPCEGCEAIYESPIPFGELLWILEMPDYKENGPRLQITGTVYKADGITPASGVVLYVYHTNQRGLYTTRQTETGWGKRHGYIRGWLKTNEEGAYRFTTLKPAPYPGANIPAHIHITVKEPDKNEYWLDDFVFDDDPLLTPEEGNRQQNRGGNGIVTTTKNGSILHAVRNIYLGKNIPDYPKKQR